MKAKSTRRAPRWKDRPQPLDSLSPYRDAAQAPREPRRPPEQRGASPYEASREIALGYTQDRSILLP